MEFLKGETDPVGDCGNFGAGIDVHGADQFPHDSKKRTWYSRVECYGSTAEQAEELRDKVLALLQPAEPVGVVIGFQCVNKVHHYPTMAWRAEDLPVGTELFIRPPSTSETDDLLAATSLEAGAKIESLENLLRDVERGILKHQAECPMSRQQSYRVTKIRTKIKRALGIIK